MPIYEALRPCTAGSPPRYLDVGETIELPEGHGNRHLQPLDALDEAAKAKGGRPAARRRMEEMLEQARLARIPNYTRLSPAQLAAALEEHRKTAATQAAKAGLPPSFAEA